MTARQRAADAVVVVLLGLSLVAVVLGTWIQGWALGRLDLAAVIFPAASLPYAVVGAVVLRSHRRHRVGWLLLLIGVLATTGYVAEQTVLAIHGEGRHLPAGLLALWYMQWYWIPFVFAQFVGIPLLFPTGRPLSRAWRRFAAAMLGLVVVATFGGMFGQRLMLDVTSLSGAGSLDNPVGFLPFDDIEGPSTAMFVVVPLMVGGVLGIVSLVQRYRRARGAERQQMKWGALGLGMTGGAFVLWAVWDAVLGSRPALASLTNVLAPIAMGLAITRYRLWDVDRVISRTVGYLAVTAVLAAGYAALVVGVQALGGQGDLPDLVVAAATLVAAGLFQPLRRQVQAAVDRRFHRSRYDAAGVLEHFGGGLRDEVDVGALTTQMRQVVERAMEPTTITVWLPREASR